MVSPCPLLSIESTFLLPQVLIWKVAPIGLVGSNIWRICPIVGHKKEFEEQTAAGESNIPFKTVLKIIINFDVQNICLWLYQ